jgi:NAD(P) transhydrogenase subunit alpha
LTEAGRTVDKHGVTIAGPMNLASAVPYHASQMYAKNISSFLLHIAKGGTIAFDTDDQILKETLLTLGGKIVNQRIRELLGLTEREA